MTGRLIGDSIASPYAYFVTYTYSDDDVPISFGFGGWCDPVLDPEDGKRYIRRTQALLKQQEKPSSFTYYWIGEYGRQTQRPHYHAAIFTDEPNYELFTQKWDKGFTTIYPMDPARSAYIAGYCTKKWSSHDNDELYGRQPEYSRFSKTTIGLKYYPTFLDWHTSDIGSKYVSDTGDVCPVFRHKTKIYPLGRFISNRLRFDLGITGTTAYREAISPLEDSTYGVYPDTEELNARWNTYEAFKKKSKIYAPQYQTNTV